MKKRLVSLIPSVISLIIATIVYFFDTHEYKAEIALMFLGIGLAFLIFFKITYHVKTIPEGIGLTAGMIAGILMGIIIGITINAISIGLIIGAFLGYSIGVSMENVRKSSTSKQQKVITGIILTLIIIGLVVLLSQL